MCVRSVATGAACLPMREGDAVLSSKMGSRGWRRARPSSGPKRRMAGTVGGNDGDDEDAVAGVEGWARVAEDAAGCEDEEDEEASGSSEGGAKGGGRLRCCIVPCGRSRIPEGDTCGGDC